MELSYINQTKQQNKDGVLQSMVIEKRIYSHRAWWSQLWCLRSLSCENARHYSHKLHAQVQQLWPASTKHSIITLRRGSANIKNKRYNTQEPIKCPHVITPNVKTSVSLTPSNPTPKCNTNAAAHEHNRNVSQAHTANNKHIQHGK